MVAYEAVLNNATLGSVVSQACRAQIQRQRDEAARDRNNVAAGE